MGGQDKMGGGRPGFRINKGLGFLESLGLGRFLPFSLLFQSCVSLHFADPGEQEEYYKHLDLYESIIWLTQNNQPATSIQVFSESFYERSQFSF